MLRCLQDDNIGNMECTLGDLLRYHSLIYPRHADVIHIAKSRQLHMQKNHTDIHARIRVGACPSTCRPGCNFSSAWHSLSGRSSGKEAGRVLIEALHAHLPLYCHPCVYMHAYSYIHTYMHTCKHTT